ncbi:MAG: hypothetical protein HWE14_11640 [Flavobacteriia bacterium]|nr:hypothetical protein [Flavobacteriia bacterium]
MRKLFSILILAVIWSCGDEVVFEESPSIDLVKIGPSTVVELQDSIYIEVAYEDGDGDLGENAADAKNFFLRDERIDLTYQFRISELAPSGSNVPIKGKLILILPNTVITDGSSQEQVTYSIWVKDRAGNKSNTLTAGPITIVQP